MSATMNATPSAAPSAELQAIGGFAQVNLLELVVVTRDRRLPWWAPLACAGLVVSAALGSSLQLSPLVVALKAKATAREALVLEQTRLLEAAARQNKAGTPKDQAVALQAALTQQERVLALLGGAPSAAATPGAAATSQDFSALLEALSHTRVDGLWLTQVRFDRRTQEVRLEGQTRQAPLVSTYINDLSRNPRFKGLVLAAVEVTRPAARGAASNEAPELARFKLASATFSPANAAAAVPAATPAGTVK